MFHKNKNKSYFLKNKRKFFEISYINWESLVKEVFQRSARPGRSSTAIRCSATAT